MEPLLSVVIACYNGAGTLGRQLSALANQDCSMPVEVIVADNGSTDASVHVANSYRDELNVRVVDASARRGPAHARNVGVAASTGRWVAFCDADDMVADDWLEQVVCALSRSSFVAGRVELQRLNSGDAARYREFEQTEGLQHSHTALDLPHAGAGNLAMTREAFLAVGGFDEGLRCLEDTDLCYRIQLAGYPLSFAPTMVVHVSVRETGWPTFRQGYGYGVGQAALEARYGRADSWATRGDVPGATRHWTARLLQRRSLHRSLWRAGFRLGLRAGAQEPARLGAQSNQRDDTARYPSRQSPGDGHAVAC